MSTIPHAGCYPTQPSVILSDGKIAGSRWLLAVGQRLPANSQQQRFFLITGAGRHVACLEYKPNLAFVMYTWPYNPMRSRRQCVLVFVLFTMIVILAGCGPRPGAAERIASDPTSPVDSALVVDLPALYIDYAADGVAYVGNKRLS
ncbi:MAG: hypothetical protein R3E79_44855 [Caldilineaceae bacterium]